jgi:hypothetical protein
VIVTPGRTPPLSSVAFPYKLPVVDEMAWAKTELDNPAATKQMARPFQNLIPLLSGPFPRAKPWFKLIGFIKITLTRATIVPMRLLACCQLYPSDKKSFIQSDAAFGHGKN